MLYVRFRSIADVYLLKFWRFKLPVSATSGRSQELDKQILFLIFDRNHER